MALRLIGWLASYNTLATKPGQKSKHYLNDFGNRSKQRGICSFLSWSDFHGQVSIFRSGNRVIDCQTRTCERNYYVQEYIFINFGGPSLTPVTLTK